MHTKSIEFQRHEVCCLRIPKYTYVATGKIGLKVTVINQLFNTVKKYASNYSMYLTRRRPQCVKTS
jgi:hypothetical protein